MQEIQSHARTVRELLSGARYGIDYYQREYKWQSKQIVELVHDLTDRFLEDYDPEDELKKVANYGHYFLGSIIISQQDEQRMIVDGQQRLTSLTLLLIYLHNLQKDRDDATSVADLIFLRNMEKSHLISMYPIAMIVWNPCLKVDLSVSWAKLNLL